MTLEIVHVFPEGVIFPIIQVNLRANPSQLVELQIRENRESAKIIRLKLLPNLEQSAEPIIS